METRETLKVKKGDAVVVSVDLEVREKYDAKNEVYLEAELPWSREKKKKPPFLIFDVYVGIYMGMKYVPTNKAKHGIIQSAKHSFFFNDHEVFIDPKYIQVVSEINESIG